MIQRFGTCESIFNYLFPQSPPPPQPRETPTPRNTRIHLASQQRQDPGRLLSQQRPARSNAERATTTAAHLINHCMSAKGAPTTAPAVPTVFPATDPTVLTVLLRTPLTAATGAVTAAQLFNSSMANKRKVMLRNGRKFIWPDCRCTDSVCREFFRPFLNPRFAPVISSSSPAAMNRSISL